MMIEILSPFLSHVNKKMKENFNRRGLSAGKIPSIFWPPEGPIGSALGRTDSRVQTDRTDFPGRRGRPAICAASPFADGSFFLSPPILRDESRMAVHTAGKTSFIRG